MGVRPDQVSGVLVGAVSRDTIDAAVAACGAGEKRSGGKLPAHVTAHLTMALCLFAEDRGVVLSGQVLDALGVRCGPGGRRVNRG